MSDVLIKNMKMPKNCTECPLETDYGTCGYYLPTKDNESDYQKRPAFCPLIEVPPHGDLIDRDALIKDGWLNLYKKVMRMGGYAIHELPLKNPSIAVIIPAEEKT